MSQQSGNEKQAPMLLEPSAAMKQLKVSPSGLRRLGMLYEKVHGELPRKDTGSDRGNARLWPVVAIERLTDARRLLDQGRAASIVKGLEALEQGVTPDDAPDWLETDDKSTPEVTAQALHLLIGEIQALRREVSEQRLEIAELRADRKNELAAAPKAEGFLSRLRKRWQRIKTAITEDENS